MSAIMRDAGPEPGWTGQNLARIIQAGLELRRFAAPQPKAPTAGPTVLGIQPWPPLPNLLLPSVRPALDPFANSLGHKATARPGLLGSLIRHTRRGFKALLRPWLEIQTRFNHATIEGLEHSHAIIQAYLDQLTAQLNAQSQMLAALSCALDERTQAWHDQHRALEARLEDCHDCLHTSREMLEARIAKLREGVSAGGKAPEILEHLFVQTRLPAPPARILDLSWPGHRNSVEVSSLGYEVVCRNLLPGQYAGSLPFEDQCFDGIVCLSAFADCPEEADAAEQYLASEAARVLCRRGRLLITVRGPSPGVEHYWVANRTGMEQRLKPFQVIEQAFGVQDQGTWSFTTNSPRARWEQNSALALVLAEKP